MKDYHFIADALIFSSLYEGFGMPIVEALLYGIPVVSSNVGITPEVIEDGKNGYLLPSVNEKYIAELICRIINEGPSVSYDSLLYKGKERFEPKSYTQNLIKIYKQFE